MEDLNEPSQNIFSCCVVRFDAGWLRKARCARGTRRLAVSLYQQLAQDAGTPVIGKMVVLGDGLNRGHLYNYIHSGLGIDINGYAGSNMDNWITQLEKVMAFEEAHPFDPYQAVPAKQLNKEKLPEAQRRAKGLAEMIAFLKAIKPN